MGTGYNRFISNRIAYENRYFHPVVIITFFPLQNTPTALRVLKGIPPPPISQVQALDSHYRSSPAAPMLGNNHQIGITHLLKSHPFSFRAILFVGLAATEMAGSGESGRV